MRTKDFDETEILRKAIRIFWRQGYHATSLYDLIEELGIGRSSIYHAFGDKRTLFMKALELYQQEATERFKTAFEAAPSVKMIIADFLNAVANDVFSEACPKGCFKVNAEIEVADQDEQIKKIIAEDDLLIEDVLYKAIEKAQQNGEISTEKDPKALARFLCNTIAGMRVYAKFRTDRQFFDDIIATAMTAFN